MLNTDQNKNQLFSVGKIILLVSCVLFLFYSFSGNSSSSSNSSNGRGGSSTDVIVSDSSSATTNLRSSSPSFSSLSPYLQSSATSQALVELIGKEYKCKKEPTHPESQISNYTMKTNGFVIAMTVPERDILTKYI
jgi:hypothetical protein